MQQQLNDLGYFEPHRPSDAPEKSEEMRNYSQYLNRKRTVESALSLSASQFKKALEKAEKADIDRVYEEGTIKWRRGGLIGGYQESTMGFYVIRHEGQSFIQVSYTQGEQTHKQRIEGVFTRPYYGGYRFWLLCACGKRQTKLYKVGEHPFSCRGCHDLTYESTRDPDAPTRKRIRAIHKRFGMKAMTLFDPLPSKPKNMTWQTYFRLLNEYEDLQLDQFVNTFSSWGLDGFDEEVAKLRAFKVARQEYIFEKTREGIQEALEASRQAAEETIRQLDKEIEREKAAKYGTLGDVARRGGVSYEFAKEAQAKGLIRPDKGRSERKKRYRVKLGSWLEKLHVLYHAGYSWQELKDWSKRRFKAGHSDEVRWPRGFSEKS